MNPTSCQNSDAVLLACVNDLRRGRAMRKRGMTPRAVCPEKREILLGVLPDHFVVMVIPWNRGWWEFLYRERGLL